MPAYPTSLPTLPNIPKELIEAANALYSRLNDPMPTLGQKLEWTYSFLDRFETFAATFTNCGRGCSHCCKIDIQITTLEAEYIQVKTGIPHHPGMSLTTGHRTPCPFLGKDQACGIYEHRPIICRTHHAAGDPENCRPGREQIQYGSAPDFGNPIYKNLIGWTHHLAIHEGGALRDIRDFFPAVAV